MFALELSLNQPSPRFENFLIRKPALTIGSGESATIKLDELSGLEYQLSISRELGRRFKVSPVSLTGQPISSSMLGGIYDTEADLTLGSVGIRVLAVDGDLALKENEPPDRAGVRILRQAAAQKPPELPALMLQGDPSGLLSFSPDQVLYVGRGPENTFQVDAVDISHKHARIGFESGSFWVEDLGSTNGTFFQGQQISTRTTIPAGEPIVLGRNTTIIGLTAERDLTRINKSSEASIIPKTQEKFYPVLVTLSEVVRPSRLVLEVDKTINLGRDSKNDLWLGVPHVSREHCSFSVTKTGEVIVKDTSTNGTVYDQGVLANSEELRVRNHPRIFDFGKNVTIALCFNEEQEKTFLNSGGSATAFLDLLDVSLPAKLNKSKAKKPILGNVTYLERFKAVYQSLSFLGQLLLVFTVIATIVILVLIAGLLTKVFI
ncbi:MAG: FHA domain-containing protein [Bdellovibrionota bacterium]